MNLGLGGLDTFQHVLASNVQVPVCNAFEANEYNMYGDCPANGRYHFANTYAFPAPETDFMAWALSGYEGHVQIDIKLFTDLVGRCVVPVKTYVPNGYENGFFKSAPSGMVTGVVVLVFAGLLAMYLACQCFKCCRARSRDGPKGKSLLHETELATAAKREAEAEPTTEYSRMVDAGGADKDIVMPSIMTSSVDEIEQARSRTYEDGPVI